MTHMLFHINILLKFFFFNTSTVHQTYQSSTYALWKQKPEYEYCFQWINFLSILDDFDTFNRYNIKFIIQRQDG